MTKIQDIAYYLPEHQVSNAQLHAENPTWDMKRVEARAGVVTRHVSGKNETSLDLAEKACRKLFQSSPQAQGQVDGLMFCTQTPDHIMPPNSCILHSSLDLPEDTFVFDFNLACSGYIYGLALAHGLILSQTCRNILFVTADTYSKLIHPQDRAARVLFGDGAAASLISASDSHEGIIDIQCSTAGRHYEKFMVPAGGYRMPRTTSTHQALTDGSGNVRTLENIRMDGMGVMAFVNERVPAQVLKILQRNRLGVEDIDLFIFHQASKMALDSITRLLKVPPGKVFRNLREKGNTVSASIPIALKDAIDSGRVSPGQKILLCGFGVGLSWGSAILQM